MQPWELQLLRLTTALRSQLLASLTDADLAFALPGNPPLGDLCRDIGDTERAVCRLVPDAPAWSGT